jgi:serine/threonine-protein kinase HipA
MADLPVSILEVQLYGRTIGTLTNLGGDRTIFAFTEDYIADDDRQVLSLSFKDAFGNLITDLPATQRRLLPFFANLLPEGHLRDYLAQRAGVDPAREFFLLWALGQDLPGALTVRPADGEAWPPGLDEEAREVRPGRRENALRFSLAGVQLKFSAISEHAKGGGLSIPAEGVGGCWIVKLPSTRFDNVPENEFAMMTLARLVGIDVPEFTLIETDAIDGLPEGLGTLRGQRSYAIKRFDRTADGPIHTEDFAQVFGVYPDDKYRKGTARHIAKVLGIETGEADVAEFFRRLVFNVLIGNADMHLKNWSLIYPDGRTPMIAPAYDFVSTIAYLEDDEAAIKFSQTKRFDRFTEDEISRLANKAGLPERPALQVAWETIERFRAVWADEKSHLPLPKDLRTTIEVHLAKLPIIRG